MDSNKPSVQNGNMTTSTNNICMSSYLRNRWTNRKRNTNHFNVIFSNIIATPTVKISYIDYGDSLRSDKKIALEAVR